MSKKFFPKAVTPVSVAAYCYIHKADTEGEHADGKFKVTARFLKEGNEEFLETLESKCREAAKLEWGEVPEELDLPIRDGDLRAEEKQNAEEFAGHWYINAKSKFQPGIAVRKGVDPTSKVFSGDMIKVSFLLIPYTSTETERVNGRKKTVTVHGVTAQLRNVLLHEKINNGGSASSDFDDDDVEDAIAEQPQAEQGPAHAPPLNGDQGDYDDI